MVTQAQGLAIFEREHEAAMARFDRLAAEHADEMLRSDPEYALIAMANFEAVMEWLERAARDDCE